ncbi:hypothetical protein AGDE_14032 [Angomonas deanei]|uniref:Uncharacterized protein n=1 Tax=Angomonas deanei TaxID=59799 RepID=A0A7G2CSY9_9TRYP|nr:hypothetical protein AGDE_14032 [Angomonas deanei]CAD2222908.1 hypothetical protein, conserved [Angomonas deanei]|eukprot:EPY21511.1 hypothetical protein AGDE_14032 [Angomonas deanei]
MGRPHRCRHCRGTRCRRPPHCLVRGTTSWGTRPWTSGHRQAPPRYNEAVRSPYLGSATTFTSGGRSPPYTAAAPPPYGAA